MCQLLDSVHHLSFFLSTARNQFIPKINWIRAVDKKSENCSKWPKSVDQMNFEQSNFEQFTPTLCFYFIGVSIGSLHFQIMFHFLGICIEFVIFHTMFSLYSSLFLFDPLFFKLCFTSYDSGLNLLLFKLYFNFKGVLIKSVVWKLYFHFIEICNQNNVFRSLD